MSDKERLRLLDLLEALPPLPPLTSILGLADDGRPVLLNLLAPDVSHILVAGDAVAGKTVLLRSLALSLALVNKQSQLQLIVIDPNSSLGGIGTEADNLGQLNYLPHLLAPVVEDLDDIVAILDFLVEEMDYRLEQKVATPVIVVIIDKLLALLKAGGQPVSESLTRLLQRGAAVGIRLVLSARQASSPLLQKFLRANLPVRLVGRVQDEAEARAAAGVADSQAEFLLGKGDFIVVTVDTCLRFQGAYIGDYDLHLSLEKLHRQRRQIILAQPL